MMHTSNLDMQDTARTKDVADFIISAAWAICNTYHTVLGSMPGQTIFGRDMLFKIPYLADWRKGGEHRQMLADQNNVHESRNWIDFEYTIGQHVLLIKDISSAKQKADMKNPMSLRKCIVMAQSGFNVEIFQNESILGGLYPTSMGMFNSMCS